MRTWADPRMVRITCPAMVINADADTDVSPSTPSASMTRSQAPTKRSARSTPTTTSPPRARAASRPTPSPSGSASGGGESPRPLRSGREGTRIPRTGGRLARHQVVRRRRHAESQASFYRELPAGGGDLARAPAAVGRRPAARGAAAAGAEARRRGEHHRCRRPRRSAVSRSQTCRAPTRRRWPRARCY